MATSVKLTQVQTIPGGQPEGEEYVLTPTFSEASPSGGNWDNAFVLVKIVDPGDALLDTYQHICTVGDLEEYPADRAVAVAAPIQDYYRAASFAKAYSSLEDITAAVTTQQTRTQNLVDDWENYDGGTWPKTTVDTYTST